MLQICCFTCQFSVSTCCTRFQSILNLLKCQPAQQVAVEQEANLLMATLLQGSVLSSSQALQASSRVDGLLGSQVLLLGLLQLQHMLRRALLLCQMLQHLLQQSPWITSADAVLPYGSLSVRAV